MIALTTSQKELAFNTEKDLSEMKEKLRSQLDMIFSKQLEYDTVLDF